MVIKVLKESEWSGSKIYVLRIGLKTFQYLLIFNNKIYQDRYEVGFFTFLYKWWFYREFVNVMAERTLSSACRTINKLKTQNEPVNITPNKKRKSHKGKK